VRVFSRFQGDSNMSLYEVLDADALCRLYFDLEYKHDINPGRAASVIDNLLPQLLLQLADEALSSTGRSCDVNSMWVLDASCAEKFSQHIIIGLTGCPYVGSVHAVGQLVQRIVQSNSHQLPLVVIKSIDGARGCVIDTSVYATNQQFRVMFSSKFGQSRPLLPRNRSTGVSLAACSWELFRTSLVACMRRNNTVAALPSNANNSKSCAAVI
jgi:hypothetical protein